jgi:hypothetical protein
MTTRKTKATTKEERQRQLQKKKDKSLCCGMTGETDIRTVGRGEQVFGVSPSLRAAS